MDKERKYFKNTFHHLYNRGTSKGKIFFERENYLYFLRRLNFYRNKYKIEIISYCLMPNHFHLFVKQMTDELTISKFISALLNSYVKSVNKKYNRSGTLFESKTKDKIITDENHFVWIMKYILENTVKANLVNKVCDWEYSNAKDLLRLRNGIITNIENIIPYFQSEKQMRDFLTDTKIKVDYEF